MNQAQVESLLRILLAAGGPIAGLLVNAGMAPGSVNTLLTAVLSILPMVLSAVWGYFGHTASAQAKNAAAIPGVTVTVDPAMASSDMVKVANDSSNPVKLKAA